MNTPANGPITENGTITIADASAKPAAVVARSGEKASEATSAAWTAVGGLADEPDREEPAEVGVAQGVSQAPDACRGGNAHRRHIVGAAPVTPMPAPIP